MGRNDIIKRAIHECLDEMYKRSQPSISFDEIIKNCEAGVYDGKTAFYLQHYLPQDEYEEIIEEYMDAYNIKDAFQDHCELVYDYLAKGGTKVKYIPEKINEDGSKDPGYRGYESTPKLTDIMPEEYAQKCLDLINECKDFYNKDYYANNFRFNVMDCSPTSYKKAVKEYWESQGVNIKFQKRVYNDEDGVYEYVDDD